MRIKPRKKSKKEPKKLPQWVRIVLRWFFVIVIATFFGLVVYSLGRIVRSWNSREWYGVEPYRILVLHGIKNSEPTQLELVTIWPDTHSVISLTIPRELKVDSVGGYGTYRIGALVAFGRVEGVGERLIKDSLSFAVGVPIHQVLWESDNSINYMHAQMSLLQQGLMGEKSLDEVIDILKLLGTLNRNAIEQITLTNKNVIRSVVEVDGSESLFIEPALFDNFIKESFSTIWKEAALTQVALINASGKSQMASLWSRYPRLAGFDVVSVTDQQEIMETTEIVFSDQMTRDSVMGQVLIKLFPRAQVRVADTSRYRAQIAIIVGLDSYNWLNQKDEYLKD